MRTEQFAALEMMSPSRYQLDQRMAGVLDNARAHQTTDVKALAEELNLELMFMPPYCPEFNCIEALWSVLKKDFKRRVLLQQKVEISDDLFRRLLQESLDSVTPKVQQHAARYNNRGFMHLVTGKVANKGLDFIEEFVGRVGQFTRRERLHLVDDEEREVAALLRRHQRLVFDQREIIVIIVFAREKLEAHAGLRVPAVDVKRDPMLVKHEVAGDFVAAGTEEAGQQVAGPGFGEGVWHGV
jgi:hypothetical protein